MVEIFRGMSAELLAQRLRVPFKQLQPVLQLLADEDADVSPASALSIETAELAALEYEFDAKIVSPPGAQPPPPPPPTRAPAMPTNPSRKPRPPVVTIMGHVDHGKTTLLDSLRKTSVAAGEAGGITQHIGAFKVPLPNGGAATFLDTPGHAAFSAMRSRGARATDIVILVVAADDGVMPQTVESIEHIRASRAPMIVAVTKCDMPMSNPKNVYQQLLKHGVHVEALGGSVQSVELAAPKGLGLSDLIENIAALTEQIAPEAEQDGPAEAIAIESKQREGMGMVVTCLVTQGILREGAILVSGTAFARVRRLSNDRGEAASEAFPSDPVEVVGWKHVVELGGHIVEVPSEDRAKRLVSVRASKKQSQQTSQAPNLASEGFSDQMSREDRRLRSVRLASHGRIVVAKRGIDAEATQHNVKEAEAAARAEPVSLNIVLKADVVGSMEAIAACLAGLPQSQVRVSVVRQDIGAITQSDIDIAAASDGVIITFSQPAPSKAIDTKARAAGVDIRSYNIIYKLLDDMKELMRSRLPSRTVEKTLGTANVLACFPHSRVPGLIAGVRVQTGSMLRKHNFSVTRKGQVIFSGKAVALRHVKQDVETLDRGGEGGLQLEKFGPFEIGDEIRCFELKEERPEIEEY
ncbi:translation initiation factor IF-2 [Capsaspora owczarzaki ATCC 30864]|uniref:Translation initiation factor IF-2 n=1 Tax=Capsaspora owczarzaki (strain ATCC 30864) TaxID=595528 RepID=A0A0D2WLI3_CAPO3|nr:translation initiation factor IF-2 [Capsaspora owczarzaki ATCC 30864]KJE91445.1 translation initiation factor IF-2 [Capsaspora owczarzaki ATCC 30864]|eukprot:XP_004349329.1 translation initiation factor IF-2 [Capsaspora owczarzaki ATCC 30864]